MLWNFRLWLDMDGDEQGEKRNLYHLLLLLLLLLLVESVGSMRDRTLFGNTSCAKAWMMMMRQDMKERSCLYHLLENLPGRDPRGDYKADWLATKEQLSPPCRSFARPSDDGSKLTMAFSRRWLRSDNGSDPTMARPSNDGSEPAQRL